MIETYLIIIDAIKRSLPWAQWIDWDKGQLDEPEKFNAIVVPGILVDPSAVEWEQLGKGFQLGNGPITIKLVTLLPAQTHALDPLLPENLKVQRMAEQLHETMLAVSGVLRRTGSPKPYWASTYFVIEQTYDFRHTYQPDIPLAPLPSPAINATITVTL
ncbi:hypothetical protein ACFPMF_01785 [Larkinella bovis]|uniref:Uncharacterized protein n=1 Tax=Larkinella bovis TaxID=683041 RepID=A0ABW0I9P1_9BACT